MAFGITNTSGKKSSCSVETISCPRQQHLHTRHGQSQSHQIDRLSLSTSNPHRICVCSLVRGKAIMEQVPCTGQLHLHRPPHSKLTESTNHHASISSLSPLQHLAFSLVKSLELESLIWKDSARKLFLGRNERAHVNRDECFHVRVSSIPTSTLVVSCMVSGSQKNKKADPSLTMRLSPSVVMPHPWFVLVLPCQSQIIQARYHITPGPSRQANADIHSTLSYHCPILFNIAHARNFCARFSFIFTISFQDEHGSLEYR